MFAEFCNSEDHCWTPETVSSQPRGSIEPGLWTTFKVQVIISEARIFVSFNASVQGTAVLRAHLTRLSIS